jgi:hypothetical protein
MSETATQAPHRHGNVSYWIALLLPAAAWLLQLQSNYALVQLACASGSLLVLHVSSLLFLSASLLGGVIAMRDWRRAGRKWPGGEDSGLSASHRTMAVLALMSSALFSLVIIAQWLPVLFIDPCHA